MSSYRTVKQLHRAVRTSDGDGVNIRRIAGFNQPNFSPFLMIDELKSDEAADYIGGFPPHPHRGIETLTYMLNGHFQHKDHMGNVGELRSGGAQWMSAGRGVIHSEMPIMTEGQLHGFQIWINQPAKNKMSPAQYHDFQPESITEKSHPDWGLVRVIAGALSIDAQEIAGPLQSSSIAMTIADWRSNAAHNLTVEIPADLQCLVFVYQGKIAIDQQLISAGQLGILSSADQLKLSALEESGALILAGMPIHEPIVHYGPFVMNSVEEIEQAIKDYQTGNFV
ncbi:quercetin 2,3-dioxygenase [Vibrio cidicii]|nr:pirin family protein [Vibrio cidicii]EJN6826567.1 pirin family protein [Vibrio cidicii]KYN79828.1 quercetin 2,3-dioxygenase [Vibrio cidicii]